MNLPRTGSLYFLNGSRLYVTNVGLRTVALKSNDNTRFEESHMKFFRQRAACSMH